MSVRPVTFREAEDLIAYYAPARYPCGLMDSNWSPDHITIFEFTKMLGPVGMEFLNRKVISQAEELGPLDSKKLMAWKRRFQKGPNLPVCRAHGPVY